VRPGLLLLLPVGFFVGFAGLAYVALTQGDDTLPTALAGRPAPSLAATVALREDAPPEDAAMTAPGVKLVNFWASWCAPCRVEHPVLTELAAEGVPIVGVNYKDRPENALAFLEELGDPYRSIGADPAGRVGIDWGLYGVPETFVVDGEGRIVMRHAGPITPEILEQRIRPLLEAPAPGT
jgi:cytochrome c biogenesis protein CcmG/thiol:disulfide interchange protein DsbE